MANDPDAGPPVFVGASGEPVQLRPVHGVVEDANGNRFKFVLSVTFSVPTVPATGPQVPHPPPKVPVMPPKLITAMRLDFPAD